MKTKILTFIALGCLIFTACSKEGEPITDDRSPKIDLNKISIHGIYYDKDSVMFEVSKGLGLDTSMFYFDQTSEKFKLRDFDLEFSADTYLKLD